jgi:hypothetical protein
LILFKFLYAGIEAAWIQYGGGVERLLEAPVQLRQRG